MTLNYTLGQRSQDIDLHYYENGNIYISSYDNVMSGFIMNNSSRCFEIEEIPYGIDIDTKTDFDVAELIFQKYKNIIDY